MGQPVSAPQQLRKDVRGEMIEAEMVERPPFLFEQICSIMPSLSDKENYAYLQHAASMEEFVDQMPIHAITDEGVSSRIGNSGPGYEIVNKTFAGALLFRRDDLSDAKIGGFRQRISDQVAAAYGYPDERLITKVVAGESERCYLPGTTDYFFSATHEARGRMTATWSNIHTGTGTSVAQIAADIGSAIGMLYNMRNDANRPMNRYLRQIFVMFNPTHEAAMRTAILAPMVSSTSNVGYRPTIVPMPEPLLDILDASNPNDYYVGFNDPGVVRPFIWQAREDVMSEEIGEGSELWTNLRQIEYAVTRRGEAGFGFPERVVKVNNA